MNIPRRLLLAVSLIWLAGCSPRNFPGGEGRWIDLTHAFSAQTLYWPTATSFSLKEVFHGTTPGGFHYEANQFCAAEHGGTHLDAPNHFAARGVSADRIPLEWLIGPAVVVDVSAKALANPDYRIGVADLEDFERRHGGIPREAIVLLRTGYDRYWPDPVKYLGTAERGAAAVAKLHFPGLDPTAAEWLVRSRSIKAVGLDTASIDYGQSTGFESHRVLTAAGVPIFENVADSGRLPPLGAVVVALPMKIEGGSGAPLRLVAWVPGQ